MFPAGALPPWALSTSITRRVWGCCPMRFWHIVVSILALAIVLSICRDQVGRIALIVFVTALGEVVFGTTAVLALFQTIGSLGEAKGLFNHAEAVATTTLVLILATAIMSSWLFAGAWLVQASITDRRFSVSGYVPATYPHAVASRGGRAQDLGPDRAVVSEADGTAGDHSRRARALVDRSRGAELRGGRRRGRALRRDDLSDRRPRARGGAPGLRPRDRAEAQADPERDPRPLPRLAVPRGAAARIAMRVRPGAENRRALFREANIPRETELAELEQQYQKMIGAMTVNFRGEERTLAQMAPFLEETDRSLASRSLGARGPAAAARPRRLDDLFDQMKLLRIEVATRPASPTTSSMRFASASGSITASPIVSGFTDTIERVVVPLARQLQEAHRSTLGVDTLRPWDLGVDPLGRPPLVPFKDVDELAAGTGTIFRDVDPELGDQFAFLRERQLLDLANRKGKAPGGYQTTLEDDAAAVYLHERRRPRLRRAHPAPRRGPRLPYPGLPGASPWRPIAEARSSSAKSPR